MVSNKGLFISLRD